jgi:hypothetical protein
MSDDLAPLDAALQREIAARISPRAGGAAGGGEAFQPGQEAATLRRLLASLGEGIRPGAVVRIWREIFAASRPEMTVAVCETDENFGFTQAAREHFGALVPIRMHRSPAQVMAEVSAGSAAVAVLPMPAEDDSRRDAWWTALLQKDEPRIHVVARLPFWAPRAEGAPRVRALVIAAAAPDPTEHDRSLLGLEIPQDVSRARLSGALVSAGLQPESVILRRDPGLDVAQVLIEVTGHVVDGDPRLTGLAQVLRPPIVLGAYAVPMENAHG